MNKERQKNEKDIEISKEEFLLRYQVQEEALTREAYNIQLRLIGLHSILERANKAENNNLRVQYFVGEEDGTLGVLIGLRGQAGFILPDDQREDK